MNELGGLAHLMNVLSTPYPSTLAVIARITCTDQKTFVQPGAFYIRTHNPNGVKADPSRWVIFMEGGGW